MTAQVADAFRKDAIFLVGDAAHRFPPTGGYGINTGVQDAHNLVWKLKAALSGIAGDGLLDTYEAERRPVAIANCARSIANQDEMDAINEAVALRASDMRKAHGLMESRLFRSMPKSTQLGAARNITKLGLRKIRWLNDPGPRGQKLRHKLATAAEEQKAHFGGAHGIELGYRYTDGLTLGDPPSATELSASDLEYKPIAVPGARIPHSWVERDKAICSTLDLLDYDQLQLWVSPAWKEDWSAAIAQSSSHIPTTIVSIGEGASADAEPCDGIWSQRRGIDGSGALLVRPDGHIIWRTRSIPSNPGETLHIVFQQLAETYGPTHGAPA